MKKTNLLVSLKSLEEITGEVLRNVDIIDLKDPEKGSIGAWSEKKIFEAVKIISKKKLISATLGDVKDIEEIIDKIKVFDNYKLDFIKFGIFSENIEELNILFGLINKVKIKTELVCVAFVENFCVLNYLEKNLYLIKKSGINFLLLDTGLKSRGSLLSYCKINFLKKFILKCESNGIYIGLAGRLGVEQIKKLLKLEPFIIGMRSVVCCDSNRNLLISEEKVKKISSYF